MQEARSVLEAGMGGVERKPGPGYRGLRTPHPGHGLFFVGSGESEGFSKQRRV